MPQMKYVVQASTLLLFAVPMCVMTVLYVLIALALRRRSTARESYIRGGGGEDDDDNSVLRRHDGSVSTDRRRRRLSPVISQLPNTSRRTVVRILGQSLCRPTNYFIMSPNSRSLSCLLVALSTLFIALLAGML